MPEPSLQARHSVRSTPFPPHRRGSEVARRSLFRHPCSEGLTGRSRRAVSWQPPFATPLGSTIKAALFPSSTHRVPSHFCPHRTPLWEITPEHPTGWPRLHLYLSQKHSLHPSASPHLSSYRCQTCIWPEALSHPMPLSLPLCLSHPPPVNLSRI